MVQKRLLNIKEAAIYLGTTMGTLYQWVSQRKVPFVKLGRSTRFDIQKLDEMIRANTIETDEL